MTLLTSYPHSANLLYPREDKTNPSALLFECRTCAHSEPATTSCIFRNKLHDSVGETAGVIQDVGQDPTVGVPILCLLCGEVVRCEVCARSEKMGEMDSDSGYGGEVDGNATQETDEVTIEISGVDGASQSRIQTSG